MNQETILSEFKKKVCEQISLVEKGVHRYVVQTPFIFEDGDNFVILLKYNKEKKIWYLTDEAHTFQHMSYFIDEKDMFRGTRGKIIDDSKKMFEVVEDDGELIKEIEDKKFGDSLYDFVQCLLKISDITYLDRERVQSTFYEDFKVQIELVARKRNLTVKFKAYPEIDKTKQYPIDCVIENEKRPIFIFALLNDDKCRDSTISIYEFEKRKIDFTAVGVFDNQEKISRPVLSRFSAVCDKQIPTLQDMNNFETYLEKHIQK